MRACDVHAELDEDSTPRADSRYCSVCGKWMCDSCRADPKRRARAFGRKLKAQVSDFFREMKEAS